MARRRRRPPRQDPWTIALVVILVIVGVVLLSRRGYYYQDDQLVMLLIIGGIIAALLFSMQGRSPESLMFPLMITILVIGIILLAQGDRRIDRTLVTILIVAGIVGFVFFISRYPRRSSQEPWAFILFLVLAVVGFVALLDGVYYTHSLGWILLVSTGIVLLIYAMR